jgi:hypothetical protein
MKRISTYQSEVQRHAGTIISRAGTQYAVMRHIKPGCHGQTLVRISPRPVDIKRQARAVAKLPKN